jgi:phosphatidylserine/phosphatidylglycerophosphate/cardiolipin synthase-like enzyme
MSRLVRCAAVLIAALPVLAPGPATADVLCDPSFQDCRATLLALVRNETERLDVAMWFMEDQELADAVVAKFREGVPVRAIVDPRRNSTTPINATTLSKFQNAGIPMRYKVGGGILHWKFMIFNSQNTVQWSAANYGDYYFRPATPYLDYTDEGIYFADDAAVLNSFRRKFDDTWITTSGFSDYANISGPLTRAYPLYPIDPDMSFVPAEDFAVRSRPLYDAESRQIDVIMYKITESNHADGLIRAVGRGVPVRLITEPERYRNPSNVWQAYHVDRLYMAGIRIRNRAHAGFLHQKSTLLHGQGLTIFGSSNWTTESNRSQYEHNYFTNKAWFFTWFRNNFERKWGNLTGNAETAPFEPLPPDPPAYVAPANGTTGIAASGTATVSWRPGPWAHRADIYFGTSATPPLIASNVQVSPGSTKTYTLPPLAGGTTYYWRIVSKTMANQAASGPVSAFSTSGAEPPPPPPWCSSRSTAGRKPPASWTPPPLSQWSTAARRSAAA